MHRARPVTRFTTFLFKLVAWIEAEDLGVNRVRPVRSFLGMTTNAYLLTDIGSIVGRLGARYLCCRQDQPRTGCLIRDIRCFQILGDLMREIGVRRDFAASVPAWVPLHPRMHGRQIGVVIAGCSFQRWS